MGRIWKIAAALQVMGFLLVAMRNHDPDSGSLALLNLLGSVLLLPGTFGSLLLSPFYDRPSLLSDSEVDVLYGAIAVLLNLAALGAYTLPKLRQKRRRRRRRYA